MIGLPIDESQFRRAKLSPASFRGVGFAVDTSDLGVGRRTQVHEYPQRDKPYVEDIGRATREISVVGYVIGDDYVEQAGALVKALEQSGPGALVHPWLGSMQVTLTEKARVSFSKELGVAAVSMSFVEAGDLEFPTAVAATQAATRLSAAGLESASVASFINRFSVKGFQDFVTAAATGSLGDMLGVVSSSEVGKLLGFSDSLADTVRTAIALVSNPETLAWKVMGVFGLSGVATSAAAWSANVRSLTRVTATPKLSEPTQPLPTSTPTRRQMTQNTSAVNALGRQALLVQAVGASSLIGTELDTKAVSYQDMIVARDAVLAALDAECLTATDDVYLALQDARAAVYADLTTRARDGARLLTLTPPCVMPSVVLAYDRYEDAAREAEIIERNRVRHPGFLPATDLKVLSR